MKLDVVDQEGLALPMSHDAVNLGEKLCEINRDIPRTLKQKICHYDYRLGTLRTYPSPIL